MQDVTSYVKKLEQYYGDRISVGLLHGKMRPAEKNKVMEAFATGEIQVLVSTTVVEVGVNVPNATVMMIEDAQRFGWHSSISCGDVSEEEMHNPIVFL